MGANLNILLIEKEDAQISSFRTCVSNSWFAESTVTAVSNIHDGEVLLVRDGMDIAFLDLLYDECDIDQVFEKITAFSKYCPVVVLTDFDDRATLMKVVSKGADECLRKADLTDALLERSIQYAIDRWSLREELHESQESYKDLYNNAPNIYITIDASTNKIIQCNNRFSVKTAYSREDVIGENVFNLFHRNCRDDARDVFECFLRTGVSYETQFQIVTRDNRVLDVLFYMSAARDEWGEISYVRAIWIDISYEVQIKHALEKAKRRYQSLVERVPSVIYRCKNDEDWTMVYMNDAIEQITGYPVSDFIDNQVRSFNSIIHPDDSVYVASKVEEAVMNNRPYLLEYRLLGDSGQVIWVRERGENVEYEQGDEWLEGIISDITAEKLAYERLQKLIDAQNSMVFLSDGEKVLFANKRFYDFFGIHSLSEFYEHYRDITECFVNQLGFFDFGKVASSDINWIDALSALPGSEQAVKMIDSAGNEHAFAVKSTVFEGNTHIVIFIDISDTIAEKLELQSKVLHDKLTGAFNREYFDAHVLRRIKNYQMRGDEAALVMIDIDFFKKVNDTYGHKTGDAVLCEVVKTISRHVRQEDRLVRWGGEEFLLIIPVPTCDGAKRTAEHLRQVIEHHEFNGPGHLTCSFGVVICGNHETLAEAVERADKALYEAKKTGRNRVVCDKLPDVAVG